MLKTRGHTLLSDGAVLKVLGLCVVSYCLLYIVAPHTFVMLLPLTAMLLSFLNE